MTLLDWLSQDFADLFARDSRARVALWHDSKREFSSILPQVGAHLATREISLLVYDPEQHHGPLWLKWAAEVGPAAKGRVVLWLPFSRDDLLAEPSGPSVDGPRLDPLLEYVYSGLIWLVEGKPPSLYSFLKKHGVPLPERRAEQDALWRGGANSLLAKYTRAHLDKAEDFWRSRRISPALIEESIVGDLAERLRLLLADPEGEWARLTGAGIGAEFASQVAARYGPAAALPLDPELWAKAFVSGLLALEVYSATGEPADFPFIQLLPPPAQRAACLDFWRSWTHDRDHVVTYRRWALELESALDMRAWPGRARGRPQALRSLAAERWSSYLEGLRGCAHSEGEITDYLIRTQAVAQAEVKGFWASPDLPGWALVLELSQLITGARQAAQAASQLSTPETLVEAYERDWYTLDLAHWRLLAALRHADNLELLGSLADRFYLTYLDAVNRAFYAAYRDGHAWPPKNCRSVRELAALIAAHRRGKTALLVVDALRFDLAAALREKLVQSDVEAQLTAYVANVPSETWVGMTSLLPEVDVQLTTEGGKPQLQSRTVGGDMCFRANRWKVLEANGAESLGRERQNRQDELRHLRSMAEAPSRLPKRLVLFERGLDVLGHPTGHDVLRHFDELLEEIAHAIRRLRQWGYTEVHVVTDHGFILLHSSANLQPLQVSDDRFAVLSARWGLVASDMAHGIPVALVPFALDSAWAVALPPGLRSFSTPGAYFHGGGTLQEVVIPHLRLTFMTTAARMRVRASLPQVEIATLAVKIDLLPELPVRTDLFETAPEPIRVRVYLGTPQAPVSSIKEVDIRPDQTMPTSVTVFLDRENTFAAGAEIPVQVLDAETAEAYATGLFVRAIRDLN